MRTIALPVLSTLLGLLQSRTLLHLEILALRQQLAMVNQTPRKRLRFHWGQRLFWVWLYRLWPGCLRTLQVFKPDTLVHWHRKGFRLYWTWKSRCRLGGRPPIAPEVRELIQTMARDNVGWGAPRIHRGFTVNYRCSASTSVRRQSQSTWSIILSRHRRRGGAF
ncbi:MAG: helix-turn-helix domain-containing protein [Pseudomonadota bacterium]